MEKNQYPVIFAKEENGYSALLLDFNCATCGENFKETLAMVKDCLVGQLQTLQKDGEPLPVPSEMDEQKFCEACDEAEVDSDVAFWCLVGIEMGKTDSDLIDWVAHSTFINAGGQLDGLAKWLDINEIDLTGWNDVNDIAHLPPEGQYNVVRLLLVEIETARCFATYGFRSETFPGMWMVESPFNAPGKFCKGKVLFWRPM